MHLINYVGSLAGLPTHRPYPGIRRTVLEGRASTVSVYDFEPGVSFPVHRHPQEQLTLLLEGDARVVIGTRTFDLSSGDWFVADPNVPHGVTAGAGGLRMVAIVSPARQSGDLEENRR